VPVRPPTGEGRGRPLPALPAGWQPPRLRWNAAGFERRALAPSMMIWRLAVHWPSREKGGGSISVPAHIRLHRGRRDAETWPPFDGLLQFTGGLRKPDWRPLPALARGARGAPRPLAQLHLPYPAPHQSSLANAGRPSPLGLTLPSDHDVRIKLKASWAIWAR
jgi:hypothetical protein